MLWDYNACTLQYTLHRVQSMGQPFRVDTKKQKKHNLSVL